MEWPQATDSPTDLAVHPFRGLRFNSAQIDDLGAVTSPPYDVMDLQMIEELLQRHPRNIVRLVLPRLVAEPMHTDDPNALAAKLLHRWVEADILRPDDQPALYVYEYGDDTITVCGLIGCVELRESQERTILPHEDVIDEVVADRLAMMSAAQANLEPILLVYDGDGSTEDDLRAARSAEPLIDVVIPGPEATGEPCRHRIWAVTDSAAICSLQSAMAPHQALIADGHHRYATYLQMRDEARRVGRDGGPEARGLALLIDSSRYPLQLGAIHRTIAEVELDALSPHPDFRVESRDATDYRVGSTPQRPRHFWLTDGNRTEVLVAKVPPGEAVTDAELLHRDLLPHWGTADDQLGYHHTPEQAVAAAVREGGVAILLHPPVLAQVMKVAAAGTKLPRKSTSFGPKPRTGLVMRRFADEV